MPQRHPTVEAPVTDLEPGIGLIVHSHLRWDFVWQRPQQLLSRIARTNPVLFVEEPILLDDLEQPVLDFSTPHEGVHRAVPKLPRAMGDEAFHEDLTSAHFLLLTHAFAASGMTSSANRCIRSTPIRRASSWK